MDFLSNPIVTAVLVLVLIALGVWWFKFREPS